MNREYRLYLSPTQKLLLVLPLLAFVVGMGLVFVPGSLSGEIPLPATILFLGILAYAAYYFLSMPHRIEVDEAGRVTFVSLFGSVRVNASQIRVIRPKATQLGFLVVEHARGKTNLLPQFDDFHLFLTDLRARNPRVELRGC
ncbi:MAG: hypothetical protein Q8W51_01605 [Candidatus Palauibacterales bacterium]|nr:hypothetical protein [Candidatus Palauibacterales bacterium]MDP2528416.1 hypothetical protein [Candidatus Palauibacterales bacterium]MDP2585002.1 hypothetical protein [Candidatus Palauibacterales bacterium]